MFSADVVALVAACRTFWGDMKFNLQSSWYLASAACKSLTAPCTGTRISSAHLSPRVWHTLRIPCLKSVCSSPIVLHKYALRQRAGCLGSLFTLHVSPQNKQCFWKSKSGILDHRLFLGETERSVVSEPFHLRNLSTCCFEVYVETRPVCTNGVFTIIIKAFL